MVTKLDPKKKVGMVMMLLVVAVMVGGYPVQACDVCEDWFAEQNRQGLRDWDSLLELEVFVALYNEPLVVRSGEDFNKQCENRAFQVRDKAREWGRLLDVEILTARECREYYGKGTGTHAINKAKIGNECWYVDVRADKIWHPFDWD